MWEFAVWLEVAPDRARKRGVERDAMREDDTEAERLHRDRYAVSEEIYLAEADPVALADVVVDNNDLAVPRLMRLPKR